MPERTVSYVIMRDYLETLPRVYLERTAAGGARE